MHEAVMPLGLLKRAPAPALPANQGAIATLPGRVRGPERAAPATQDLLRSTYALVLAGGRGTRMRQLSDRRSKPALPFAGQLKIIDFTLGNCINSGLRRISVLTQYKAQSLIRHVAQGWGFLDARQGEFIDLAPAQQKVGTHWYAGTADAIYQNLDMLREVDPRHVIVLAGDHVYRMDYGHILADHVRRDADVTVGCVEVPLEQASAFGVMRVDDAGRVVAFDEKPVRPCPIAGHAGAALASMGIYVFNAEFLYRELKRDAADATSRHDFGGDIIPSTVARARVFAHNFVDSCVDPVGSVPYWRDVGTLDAYWAANMDLLGPRPALNLSDEAWPMRGIAHHLPPARFVADGAGRGATVVDSLVAGGCVVDAAEVRHSLLFSGVQVGPGSCIEDALLLPGVVTGRNVAVKRAIIDSRCVLPDGIRIGLCPAEDAAHFTVTASGITLVTPEMLGQEPRRCD